MEKTINPDNIKIKLKVFTEFEIFLDLVAKLKFNRLDIYDPFYIVNNTL
tara:strand:- start:409 stop:555 length:147 start_codon:yes stop_codon:yes gene_type:complete